MNTLIPTLSHDTVTRSNYFSLQDCQVAIIFHSRIVTHTFFLTIAFTHALKVATYPFQCSWYCARSGAHRCSTCNLTTCEYALAWRLLLLPATIYVSIVATCNSLLVIMRSLRRSSLLPATFTSCEKSVSGTLCCYLQTILSLLPAMICALVIVATCKQYYRC